MTSLLVAWNCWALRWSSYYSSGESNGQPTSQSIIGFIIPYTEDTWKSSSLFKVGVNSLFILVDKECFATSFSGVLQCTYINMKSITWMYERNCVVNQTKYSSLLFHNNIASHLKQMTKPGTWATQVEVQAAADYYCTDLYVLTEKPNKTGYHWIYCYKPSITNPIMTRKSIMIKHLPMYNWHTAPLFILM